MNIGRHTGVDQVKFEQEREKIPVRSILYGTLMALFMMLCLTFFLAVIIQFGWAGVENWPFTTIYLVVVYAATVFGSVAAGKRSMQQGWVVGVGVGLLSSLLILVIAFMGSRSVHLGIYFIKMLINSFIGLFGGIIGVNLSNLRN